MASLKASLNQVCADIKKYLKANNQVHLHRNVDFTNIPPDDLDILFAYFSVNLVCNLYGAKHDQQIKAFHARLQAKAAKAKSLESNADEASFEPHDPAGIGDWKYADRMKRKVFRSLESIINQDAATVSHNQYVQAAKALLEHAEKTKLDAAEIMASYESQLLILAEHLVESFLPKLGQKIKQELRSAENAVIKRMVETTDPSKEQLEIWKDEIDRIVRGFELKRFELLLAETMASNQQISEAFDFTKDLLDNYKNTSEIIIETKSTSKLKEHIGKRG